VIVRGEFKTTLIDRVLDLFMDGKVRDRAQVSDDLGVEQWQRESVDAAVSKLAREGQLERIPGKRARFRRLGQPT
jgi:hypothetical protein